MYMEYNDIKSLITEERMNQYNLGIIGAGMYGKVLRRCFLQDERANIVWVNSASEETTKSAAEEFGVAKRYRRRGGRLELIH